MLGLGKKKEGETKLLGPKEIPMLVQKHLVAESKIDPDLARIFRALVRKSPKGERAFDIRVFDESEALARKVPVKDYTSLDGHPDLIVYEGWFDEESKRVEMEERKKVSSATTIFTEAEIQQKIEALSEPGGTVFCYMARGTGHGGPLGKGAAVIELNPNYPEKGKKYLIYAADVIDMQPVGKGQLWFDSNKPKDVARWVKSVHEKRLY